MTHRPSPQAFLLDHPAFPTPVCGSDDARPDLEATVAIRKLTRDEKRRVAVQLLAASALAGEFDLWPGRRSLVSSRASRQRGHIQVVIGGFPVSLTEVHRRLGRKDSATVITRDAVIDGVAEATGIASTELRSTGGAGFFLDGPLRRTLSDLARPLDPVTARNLWAYHWNLPSLPEPGEVAFWSVTFQALARRLGAALWRMLCEQPGGAVFVDERKRLNAKCAVDSVVRVGTLVEEDLAELGTWLAASPSRSAVVLGEFPAGWNPPRPPAPDSAALAASLAVTGVTLGRARRVVEGRQGQFDPWVRADRNALTSTAQRLFDETPRIGLRGVGAGVDPIHRVLSLRREGLVEEHVLRLSGARSEELLDRLADGRVVRRDKSWRLPDPVRLNRDPLHTEVATMFAQADPRRLLHQALGGESSRALQQWARGRLDELDNEQVRDVLGQVEAGELGAGVSACRLEACLAELDLAGARPILSHIESDKVWVWQLWMDLIDHPDGWGPGEVDIEAVLGEAPRVAAELALFMFRGRGSESAGSQNSAKALLDQAIDELQGHLRGWYRILRAAALERHKLDDSAWQVKVTSRHAKLERLAAHKTAIGWINEGREPDGQRELLRLIELERSPGRMGQIYLDLGYAESTPDKESGLYLKSLRHFQAAGFRHAQHKVVFNLAMIDIDHLEIERAEARLSAAGSDEDLKSLAGKALFEVARGGFQEAGEIVASFSTVAAACPRKDQSTNDFEHLMRGILALLEGRLVEARAALVLAGEDARAWMSILDAVEGRESQRDCPDHPWQLSRTASMIRQAHRDGSPKHVDAPESLNVASAFAVALADRLLHLRDWPTAEGRRRIAEILAQNGMHGWVQSLNAGSGEADDRALIAMARLLDSRAFDCLSEAEALDLLDALELTGLVIRSIISESVIVRWGEGDEGRRVIFGCFEAIPLGGTVGSSKMWRLFRSVLSTFQDSPRGPAELLDGDDLGMVGKSAAVGTLRQEIRRVAGAHLTVLLTGESGTGKELAAVALHRLSGRSGPFVAVNLAAIADTLFEAELYGSVRGAFTGADFDRVGLVEEANGGTLFLDEIGELSLPLQVKLLRFLESGEIRRVGDRKQRRVDVRVVAATNRDLEAMVADGSFREDLYFRIVSAPIHLPPLRERGSDVLLIKEYFNRRAIQQAGVKPAVWSREADQALLAHHWKGNVRGLLRAVESALVAADGGVVRPENLRFGMADEKPVTLDVVAWEQAHRKLRRQLITNALEHSGGNRAGAARILGIARQTLLYHMRILGL